MINHTQLPLKKIVYGTIAGLVTFAVNFDTAGVADGILLCTIQASPEKPVLLEPQIEVVTAFDAGTTNVLTLGTDAASANQLLASGDVTEGTPGFYPAGAGVGKKRLIANTNIYVKYAQTGDAAEAGAARVYLKMTVMDVDQQPQLTV